VLYKNMAAGGSAASSPVRPPVHQQQQQVGSRMHGNTFVLGAQDGEAYQSGREESPDRDRFYSTVCTTSTFLP